ERTTAWRALYLYTRRQSPLVPSARTSISAQDFYLTRLVPIAYDGHYFLVVPPTRFARRAGWVGVLAGKSDRPPLPRLGEAVSSLFVAVGLKSNFARFP